MDKRQNKTGKPQNTQPAPKPQMQQKPQNTQAVQKPQTQQRPQNTPQRTQKPQKQEYNGLLFTKKNYMWMIIGVVVVAIGMLLMAGGRNTNPAVFDTNLVYNPRRITVAPIVILIGFIIEIFAILQKPVVEKSEI
jgi:hypothetical protein